MTDALALAGERAAQEAERLWNLDIYDPPRGDKRRRTPECLEVIEDIIVQAGWGFATPYRGNGQPQWCGMFASKCWRAGGLDPRWFATYFASTYRLGLWARYQKFDAKHPNPVPADSTDRRMIQKLDRDALLSFWPQRGDIVIVGDGDPKDGDHVTINMGYDSARRVFDTISGNGGGVGPNGDRREGISRKEYAIDSGGYRAMFVIRPAFGDLLAERSV